MSQKYPGGFITKTPTAPTSSAAPGIWTLDQAMQNQKAGNWPSPPSPYIEDYFSTYLYTSTGAAQTITNGIDLSTKGGLVWNKNRTGGVSDHTLFDTARGAAKTIKSNTTDAESNNSTVSAFTTTGFTTGALPVRDFVSWTFAERQKFFDVVTYTGNGVAGRTVAHNLGSTPGCIMVKCISTSEFWAVYHTSLGATKVIYLNDTQASQTISSNWNNTEPTNAVFTVGTNSIVNTNGQTYVAYLFAHNAGGFGLTGNDNVISCGSFTTDASAYANVNLGYEPQWVLQKQTDSTNSWYLTDNMRGSTTLGGQMAQLLANVSNVESTGTGGAHPTATGFESTGLAISGTFIYIAIRRGPMKVPTLGTSVFAPTTTAGTGVVVNTNFPVDLNIYGFRSGNINSQAVNDRLRGVTTTATQASSPTIKTSSTDAENTGIATVSWGNTGFTTPTTLGVSLVHWSFKRAPGFFDEVCYTGTFGPQTLTHNLGVVPEMFILKNRASGSDGNWIVYHSAVGNTAALQLNLTATPAASNVYFNSTSPTSSTFTIGTNQSTGSGATYVAYLFASCPGVSKVGTFTGTGATQVINCGFTTGARFVLIKATSTTGDWYVWDSARGIVAGNDPYIELNTTDAEVTTTDWVDTAASGFELSNSGGNLANSNGVTYIFLAIA